MISGLHCEDEFLDRAANELLKISKALDATDNGAVRELLYALFRILMFCAQHVGYQPEIFASSARKISRQLNGLQRTRGCGCPWRRMRESKTSLKI